VSNQQQESLNESALVQSIEKELKTGKKLIKSYEGNQGLLYALKLNGQCYLIKKANTSKTILSFFNQRSLKKESKIYNKLRGLKGIPGCYGLTNNGDLILEHIEGHSYREKQYELSDNEIFFQSLFELITTMHKMGVAHGDLKRKDNILVNANNEPFLIDFGTAITINKESWIIQKWGFNFLRKTDLNAWIKHKYKRNYEDIDTKDLIYYAPTLVEKYYRIIRNLIYKN
jgi:predicted Ser/Thr protein kinase